MSFLRGQGILLFAVCALCYATDVSGQMNGTSTTTPTDAQNIPAPEEVYPFRAQELDGLAALRHFTRNIGIGLNIEDGFKLTEPVNLDANLTRVDYLASLASLFDFVWYFDGHILYASPVSTMETRVFSLQSTTGPELVDLLSTLDVLQPKFKHRADESRQALLVSGPKSYIEVVAQVVEAVEGAERQKVVIIRGGAGSSAARLAQQGQTTLNEGAAQGSGG